MISRSMPPLTDAQIYLVDDRNVVRPFAVRQYSEVLLTWHDGHYR
jgi:hypothetical protein